MKGTHKIIVQNKRSRYDFEIRRNLTMIQGDSATGKTTLISMIQEFYENVYKYNYKRFDFVYQQSIIEGSRIYETENI